MENGATLREVRHNEVSILNHLIQGNQIWSDFHASTIRVVQKSKSKQTTNTRNSQRVRSLKDFRRHSYQVLNGRAFLLTFICSMDNLSCFFSESTSDATDVHGKTTSATPTSIANCDKTARLPEAAHASIERECLISCACWWQKASSKLRIKFDRSPLISSWISEGQIIVWGRSSVSLAVPRYQTYDPF